MSKQPGQDYADVLLERYLAGDLAPELRAEIERGCERSELLRGRLDELRREREAFLAEDPPEMFAHRVAVELQVRVVDVPRRRRWLAWLLAPSAAAAAAAVLVTVVVVRTGPEQSHPNSAPMVAPRTAVPAGAPAASSSRPATMPSPPAKRPAPVVEAEPAPAPEPTDETSLGYAREEKPQASRRADAPRPVATPRTTKSPKAKPKKRRRSAIGGGAGGGGGGGGRSGGLDALMEPSEAPAPAESLMAAPPRTTKSELDKSDIMGGVKKGMGAVMGCIKTARKNGELAPGRHTLVLKWTILPSGKVASPELVGPSHVLGTSLPACFARGMRKWRFPATEKGGPVHNFPFGPFSIE